MESTSHSGMRVALRAELGQQADVIVQIPPFGPLPEVVRYKGDLYQLCEEGEPDFGQDVAAVYVNITAYDCDTAAEVG